ncbi:malonate decarboxylase holo-[acyl-carrier-protein] synthase [uncultured Cohaesibacter sp.]|uniref:malonate decarboxylase holo-[acyl-carrier-protein] synthase n=1 Tax=uncultured Cohaesibacter sp. TaxID=1002546 RepID=UPI0029C7BB99|nr:malonate decarboxylase holo-[acyl-carrier-protein] synthase [uncultured Cohaesibacter sp.]
MQLQRHDLVDFVPAYHARLAEVAVEGLLPCCRQHDVAPKVEAFLHQHPLPGIVCRPVQEVGADQVQLGLSFPFRVEGVRVRSSLLVDKPMIARVISPFDLVSGARLASPAFQAMLDEITLAAERCGLQMGLIGSAALEIHTGHGYTSASSDLDLVVKAASHDCLKEFYLTISNIGQDYGRATDAEVILADGNGVKLSELVSKSPNILAKSLTDVCLLNRDSVLKTLVVAAE